MASPPRVNNRDIVETTPEQDEDTEKNRQIANWFCLVLGLVIFVICAALKVAFGNSSRSTLKTVHKSDYLKNVVSQANEFCDGDDICKQIGDDIIKSINKSIDPCDNFYEYACQGWEKNNPRPENMPKWSVFSKLRTQNTKRVIRILEKSDRKSLKDAKQFYRKCVEIENKSSESEDKAAIQLMGNTLEKYGGWPILYENETWNKSSFDWISSVVGLKRQFMSTELIDVLSLQYPSDMRKTNTILIRPPISSFKDIYQFINSNKPYEGSESLVNFQNLIVNISKVFLEFQGKSNVIESYLEKRAIDITILIQKLLTIQDSTFNISEVWDKLYLGMFFHDKFANTSLSKIQYILDKNMVPFQNKLSLPKLLQNLYLHTNVYIRSNEPVVISDLKYLLNLASFLAKAKQVDLANYLHLRLILLMIPLSGHRKLNKLLEDFQNGLSGTTGRKERKEICAEATQSKFSIAVGHAFVQTKSKHNDLEFKQAKIIFDNLKVSFKDLIGSSNMNYLNKPKLKHKTKITKLCIGYPSWMKKPSWNKVQTEYKGLVMNESATFLEQNLAINSWATDKSYGGLRQQLQNDNCQWTEFAGNVEVFNDIGRHYVYLPFGIMQLPFFNIFMPKALMYGKVGSVLGHYIIRGLVEPGWSKFENGSLTPSGKCLINQYSNMSTPVMTQENVTLNGLKMLEANIADNAGLLGAYNAFKESTRLDAGGSSKEMEGLKDYTDEQLFFLGFAQNWCETSTEIGFRKSLRKVDRPPGTFRVLGSLQNSYEFAKAWKCPLKSNMNPFPKQDYQKCKIF